MFRNSRTPMSATTYWASPVQQICHERRKNLHQTGVQGSAAMLAANKNRVCAACNTKNHSSN